MSGIEDRIAEVLGEHRLSVDPSGHINGTVPGSVTVYDCDCGHCVNAVFDDAAAHLAAVLVKELGLIQEWTWTWTSDAAHGIPGYGFSVDSRSEAEEEGPGMDIVTRYVTGWSRDE